MRWYRRMLCVLPARLREESEAELVEVFRDAYARRRGSRVVFWLRMAFDLGVTAMAEIAAGDGRGPRRARRAGLRAAGLDLLVAVRRLSREPAYAASAAAALGLGVAATVLVVTLVRGVLLAPLPYAEPDRLVRLLEVDSTGRRWYPSFPNVRDWREHATFLEAVAATDVPQQRSVLLDGGSLRASVSGFSRGFLETLGVVPLAGRAFTDAENAPGGAPVAMISEEFWRGALGGRPLDAIDLTIGAETFAVIGVLPARFRFLGDPGEWESVAVWLPMERSDLGGRQSHGYHTVARLSPGMTLADAAGRMSALARSLKRQHGEPTQADDVRTAALVDEVVGAARQPLRLLLAASMFVLLVTCFNLAGTVVARGLGRTRELAVRVALGARRRDLVRHVLIETGVLAVPGAAIGIGLAALGLRALHALDLSVPRLDEARLDAPVLLATVALAAAVAVGGGLLPALTLSVRDLAARLRTAGPTTHTREQRHMWSAFVVLQVALTLVLLAGTGLLLRSLHRIATRDVGYDASALLAVDVWLPELHYDDPARRLSYYAEALERIRAIPGVEAAGLTSTLPHETTERTATTSDPRADARTVFAGYRVVDPGYLAALGVPRVAGEALRAGAPQPGAALVDTALARQLWGGAPAIGREVRSLYAEDTVRVAGTVGSIREWNRETTTGVVYVDYRDRPDWLLDMHMVVRPATAEVAAGVRAALHQVDPLVPVTVERLERRIARTWGERRLLLLTAGTFAAITLLLAALGIYAVVAYAVSRELRAAAIRLTLGARPGDVVSRLLVRGLRPVLVGLAAGLLAAVPALFGLRSQLYGVGPLDAPSLLAGLIVLGATGALAAWLPARTAGRVDPCAILRPD